MSENYELTAWADEDLLGIAHHTLDHWGKPQAERYDLQLRERFTIIGEGAVPFQLPLKRYPKLRLYRYGEHRIFYLHDPNAKPVIIAVFHRKMNLKHHLLERLKQHNA